MSHPNNPTVNGQTTKSNTVAPNTYIPSSHTIASDSPLSSDPRIGNQNKSKGSPQPHSPIAIRSNTAATAISRTPLSTAARRMENTDDHAPYLPPNAATASTPTWSFGHANEHVSTPSTNRSSQASTASVSASGSRAPSSSSDTPSRPRPRPLTPVLGKRARDLTADSPGGPMSKRATPDPIPSAAPPDMAVDDQEGFDPWMRDLFGSDPKQDFESFRQAQIEAEKRYQQEAKRLAQEKADEEMARQLDAEINAGTWSDDPPRSRPANSARATQSVFGQNGKVRAPSPPALSTGAFNPHWTPPKLKDLGANNPQSGPSYQPPLGRLQKPNMSGHRPQTTGFLQIDENEDDDDDEPQVLSSIPVTSQHQPNSRRSLPWTNPPNSTSQLGPGASTPDVDLIDLTGSGVSYPNIYNPSLPRMQHGAAGTSVYNTTMNRLQSNLGYGASSGSSAALGNPTSSYGSVLPGFANLPNHSGSQYGGMHSDLYGSPAMPGTFPSSLPTPMAWDDEDDDLHMYGNPYGYNHGAYHDQDNTAALKDLLNNIRPDEEQNLGADDSDGTPEGMASTANLYKYQAKGLTWLTKMEEGSNKGSVLADDMGLGKTIQAIALMVSRQSSDAKRKTNLIVAPVALIRQWQSEIETKIRPSHKLTTYLFHGNTADKKKATFKTLAQFDVVITTFGALQSDMKKKARMLKCQKDNPGYRPQEKERPVLVGEHCKWYRVILDEAQNIKNKTAKTSLAAYDLQSTYRLCMTGTPMMNNVVELYSLVHFLRIQPYCQWNNFNMDFARPLKSAHSYGRGRAMQKMQALCKAVMLRRTKKSTMDGKPLVDLPERQVEKVSTEFEDDEKAFYQALETKSQLTFNKFLKAGTVGRNYSNMLTLLLRLRQAACHPHLIKDFAVAVDANPEDLREAARNLPEETVRRLIAEGLPECPLCYDVDPNYTIFNPCGHNVCPDDFCRLNEHAKQQLAANDGSGGPVLSCPNCRVQVDPKKVTDHAHFKLIHQPELAAQEGLADIDDGSDDEDDDSDSSSESEDGETDDNGSDLDDFVVADDEPLEDATTEDESDEDGDDLDDTKPMSASAAKQKEKKTRKTKLKKEEADGESDDDTFVEEKSGREKGDNSSATAKGKKPAKDKKKKGKRVENKKEKKAKGKSNRKSLAMLKKEAMRSKGARKAYMKRLAKGFVPSAKTAKTMEILQGIQDDPEGEKTIVFSQFTSLLDLIEIPINQTGWRYTRFDGSMNAIDRDNSVQLFTKDPRCKIMLVSLKAGNAGLNLTAASQVIILDPFWNPYIEEQAIDRAHRIGQRRRVQIHRILVENTVEDRILELQEKKRELIEGALDESAAQGIGRLGVQELAFLFGVRS